MNAKNSENTKEMQDYLKVVTKSWQTNVEYEKIITVEDSILNFILGSCGCPLINKILSPLKNNPTETHYFCFSTDKFITEDKKYYEIYRKLISNKFPSIKYCDGKLIIECKYLKKFEKTFDIKVILPEEFDWDEIDLIEK